MNKSGIVFCLIFSVCQAFAQTDNDNMENAEPLRLGEFVNSFTDGNTIQYECIDESLTGKCIKYHNDQWFTFNSGSLSQLYINISNQECRDLYGVQLIVLDGELCEPETYEILDCVSLATQDDIFVELNGLKTNHNYWLIVDGYLEDYCKFHIEASAKPSGISVQQVNLMDSKGAKYENIVNLQWKIPDSLSHDLTNVYVVKRTNKDFKFYPLDTVPIAYNAYGKMKNDYSYADTLVRPGLYYYRLIMEDNSGHQYFDSEFNYKVYGPLKTTPSDKALVLPLDFRRYTELTIVILDAVTQKKIDTFDLVFDPLKHDNFVIYTNKYANRKLEVMEVQVINNENGRRDIHYHRLKGEFKLKD